MDVDWKQIEAEQRWCYARAGVAGGTAFVLFIIGCVALCSARRRRDPSRVAITWLKVVFPFAVM